MLDDFTIHVGDVERSIGPIGELDRPKPKVLRRDELNFLFAGRTFRDQRDTIWIKPFSMNQIAADIRDEGVALIFRREGVSAIDRNAGGGSEVAGGSATAF